MAKKKRHLKHETEPVKSTVKKRASAADLLSGRNACWVYFAVYLVLTIILFHAFLFDDVMLFATDTIPDGIYTRQYYKDFHAEFGGIPRWNPLILGGLPFIDAMHGDTFYPGAWLKFFMPLTRALGHKLIWHVFLAGILMYLFLRELKVRKEAAFIGGIMYMLAPSFVTLLYSGHDAKMYVIAWLPLAFLFLEKGMNSPKLWKFTALGAVMGLLILTSHVQMAYYSYWAIGLYFLFRLFTDAMDTLKQRLMKVSMFVGAVIIALSLGAVQLLPSYSFTTSQSVRAGAERTSYEYATSWSLHPEETAGMVVSSFPGMAAGLGNRTQNTYWGRNPFKYNTEYHGILLIVFSVLALIYHRNKRTWFFFSIAMLALIYSLGANTPVYRLFYAFVPGIKNFRVPSMIIFLFLFATCVMSSNFLSALFNRNISTKSDEKRLMYAAAAIIVIALIGSIGARGIIDGWQSILYRTIPPDRTAASAANIPYMITDLWLAALFSCAALIGIWMYLSNRIGSTALVALVGLTAFVDASVVDNRYIHVINPATYHGSAPDHTVTELISRMRGDDPFRIFGFIMSASRLKSPNYYAMFGIQAADGHHNNELQSYELFKGGGMYSNYTKHWLDNGFEPDKISHNNFLKVAGVRYIPVPSGNNSQLIENPDALDRAFIVHDCVVVQNDTLAVKMLQDTSFDPSRTAIINDTCELNLPGETLPHAESVVENYTFSGSSIEFTVKCAAPGLVVLSENHVPYWTAAVDGEETRIYRAYGTFMAVACPEGDHTIKFSVISKPYEKGKKLTFMALFLSIGICIVSGASHMLRGRETVTS